MSDKQSPVFVVGLGGTCSAQSSTQAVLEKALQAARDQGARTRLFGGEFLASLPFYAPGKGEISAKARDFIDTLRAADGVILASPGYHGSISGVVKNAIDWIEETSKDTRPYLTNLPVGLIVTAGGWQAAGSTLAALRSIVHALRAWPTPFGATLNNARGLFDADGNFLDAALASQVELVGKQVVAFSRSQF